ncbi:hypothetical protein FHW96_001483 [Novosphingobium sp. SG751A]|uniref:Gfo/Idh/MocA family protein n=1 Tax=Novosphingobium sp. SG751A TaxID=2587000 RepID=UPI001556AEF6|nr:Gfo/Idh/MocA family oxidoreductase [Novosphingobium sp. SG751A]NOW45328.1 hypothetical protein [Novosphingobium sp. SG751A]
MTQRSEHDRPLGVGIVGSGLVTRSIHLPALAALADDFAVRAIWDPHADLAEATARTCGAWAAPTYEAMLADPAVEAVVIGSPPAFHAAQTIAALHAGKAMVLVEKPLCATLEEAEAIARAARETGGMVVVGAMHLFDPAWRFMAQQVKAQDSPPSLMRSCIILPPNGRFDDWASEVILPMPAPGPAHRGDDDAWRDHGAGHSRSAAGAPIAGRCFRAGSAACGSPCALRLYADPARRRADGGYVRLHAWPLAPGMDAERHRV